MAIDIHGLQCTLHRDCSVILSNKVNIGRHSNMVLLTASVAMWDLCYWCSDDDNDGALAASMQETPVQAGKYLADTSRLTL